MTTKPRAIVYARVGDSTASPDVIERQLRDAKAIAERYGFDVVDTTHDVGASSMDPDRPGFQRVLAAGHAGEADVVVVDTLDRIARTAQQWQPVREAGLRIVTGDVDPDTGDALRAMLEAMTATDGRA